MQERSGQEFLEIQERVIMDDDGHNGGRSSLKMVSIYWIKLCVLYMADNLFVSGP